MTQFNRYMNVQLRFDEESFTALKELLRQSSGSPRMEYRGSTRVGVPSEESAGERIQREALKRVFDQLRNVVYNDK